MNAELEKMNRKEIVKEMEKLYIFFPRHIFHIYTHRHRGVFKNVQEERLISI